jgi:hypothetical protein
VPIIDEACLQSFRDKHRCERCGKRGLVEPHHAASSRGMGGGWRLDIPICLLSLCRQCHQRTHDGDVGKEELLAIIAAREGCTPESIMEEIWRIRRQRKQL